MPNYRRSRVEGATYFFTIVTYRRRPLFSSAQARRLLRDVLRDVRAARYWETIAMVLLPDHMHMLWSLPPHDLDYSRRIGRFKAAFTRSFLAAGGRAAGVTAGEDRKRYAGVWQTRFWEHAIRNSRDLKMHLDYIHLNPVKHGWTRLPREWQWSSFHRYCRLGEYEKDWCGRAELPGQVEYYDPD